MQGQRLASSFPYEHYSNSLEPENQNCNTEQNSSNPSAAISRLPFSNSSTRDLLRSAFAGFLRLRLPFLTPVVAPSLISRLLYASIMSS